jgi:hypothetical protein
MPNLSGLWTSRQQLQALGAGIWPATPGAPTIGTATAGDASASVTFTAPAYTGYPAVITGYTVTSSPGGLTGTGASSPITVSGLSNGTAYTFTVTATNATGTGPASAASNSVTPIAPYSQSYTTAGTYSWIAPVGYPQMNVIVIGGGGSGGMGGGGTAGGGGGGYAKSTNLSVTPGNSYTVVVGSGGVEGSGGNWYIGTAGTQSSFNATIFGYGGGAAGNNGGQIQGGTASGGNSLNLSGGYGGSSSQAGGDGPTGGGGGFTNSGNFYAGGTANQLYGGNGGAAVSSSAGVNGSNYGGGGGGGNGRYNTTPASNCLGAGGAVFIYYP